MSFKIDTTTLRWYFRFFRDRRKSFFSPVESMFKKEKTATIYLIPSFLAIFYLCIGAYIAHPYTHQHHEHDTAPFISFALDPLSTTDISLETSSTSSHHCLICSFLKANNSALIYAESLAFQAHVYTLLPYSYQVEFYHNPSTTPYARGPPAVRFS